MQITLRKANAIQLSINEAIKGLNFQAVVLLNEYEDSKDQINAVHARFVSNNTTRTKLVGALFEIRKAVASVNAAQGINDMLAEVAMLEKNIQHVNSLATKTARASDAVIEGKLDKVRNSKDESRLYGRLDTIDTGIFDTAEINEFKREVAGLKRKKQKLQDSLLELNVKAEIKLDETTASFLTQADIL
jgi:predicted  nucleic acid-binding Zn-ribbon protein